MCCTVTGVEGTEHVQRKKERKKKERKRKKERIKERKKRKKERKKKERKLLRRNVIFVHVISKWPVSMVTKGYVCQFSTAILCKQ